ncbi:MAG: tRNA pseudouridine(55) synthase TruB [Acidiferrobacterales bacterium]|nr:tRNA pseudouridine(55) synthase TruB [Acidiferrobacterales bacterium]
MGQGKKQKGFPVDGMLLLDKPIGCSSNHALQRAKHLLNARKAGHTGSLDPLATGLLPLCFGETTKISSMFLNADKTYTVSIRLGVTTETGDSEGAVIEQKALEFDQKNLEQVLDSYRGDLMQTPPMYSALKQNGQPLYKLARQGITVERKARPVTVYSLDLVDWQNDLLKLEVSCSRGFYIRTLAEDIGNDLGCGGHVEVLRRTRVGDFSVDQSVTLDQLEAVLTPRDREKLLLPTDEGLAHLPEVRLPENLARYIKLGQSIRASNTATPGLVRVYAETTGFIGLGEVSSDFKLSPKRIFNA